MLNKMVKLGLDDKEGLFNVSKSLASKTRIDIIELLNKESLNINEIAETLGIPTSTAAFNINILEEAGIIVTELQPGTRGAMKLCSLGVSGIEAKLSAGDIQSHNNSIYIDMPIGDYSECSISPTCGIVSEIGYIDMEDKPRGFYNSARTSAQLIWFYKGRLEYRFENMLPDNAQVNVLEVSLEMCSEAPFYRNDWPSDITMWINGRELGTWTCPGDFGGRRGKLNPQWWSDSRTQYGTLKTFAVTQDGSFIDGEHISDVNIKSLDLNGNDCIRMCLGVKDDAVNVGGINIFGEKFGDFSQNIVMRIDYSI
jgi:predicted transcriptional regulator